MTAEQLEELLASCGVTNVHGYSDAYEELRALAPSLARRVIAAEKLVEALDWYEEQVALCRKITADGSAACKALDADGGRKAGLALTAYREASK